MAGDEEKMTRNFLYYKASKMVGGKLLDFDPKNIRLHAPVAKQGNAKMIKPYYLHDGVSIPLQFQTPQMFAPFELDFPPAWGEEKQKTNYKTFSLAFKNEEDDPEGELAQFRQFLDSIDTAIIGILFEHNDEWFGNRGRNPVTREIIENKYAYLIKSGANAKSGKTYPDSITVKCGVRNKIMSPAFFDEEAKKIVDESEIHMAQGEAIAVLHYSYIWVMNQFFPRLDANQVQLFADETNVSQSFGIVESVDSPPAAKRHKKNPPDEGDDAGGLGGAAAFA